MKPVKLRTLMKIPFNYFPQAKQQDHPPGTPIYTGKLTETPVRISLIEYDEQDLTEKTLESVQDCFSDNENSHVKWINVDGLHDPEVITQLGQHYQLHPLVMEDIVHVGQRPKAETSEHSIYIVMRMLYFNEDKHSIENEQISLVLGKGHLITFQEQQGDVFNPVRERIHSSRGRIRKMGPDYLAYALIDAMIDNYFQVLEVFGERIEKQEESLLGHFDKNILPEIHALKRDLTLLRKSVWPMREMVGDLERSESPLIRKATRAYLRDLYDHTIQVVDTIESFRDVSSGMMDLYLSIISNRMNDVMKVLTLIATIFIPLSFVAGVFGMNFERMPELAWKWAYPVGFWAAIGVISGLMLIYFKIKKWL